MDVICKWNVIHWWPVKTETLHFLSSVRSTVTHFSLFRLFRHALPIGDCCGLQISSYIGATVPSLSKQAMLPSGQEPSKSILVLSREATLADVMTCYREFDSVTQSSQSCTKSVKLLIDFLSDPDVRAHCDSHSRC